MTMTTKSSSGIIMRDTAGNGGSGSGGNYEDGGYVLHKDDPNEHDDEDHDEECNKSKRQGRHHLTNKVPILFVSCGGCGVSGSRSLGNAVTVSDLEDIDEKPLNRGNGKRRALLKKKKTDSKFGGGCLHWINATPCRKYTVLTLLTMVLLNILLGMIFNIPSIDRYMRNHGYNFEGRHQSLCVSKSTNPFLTFDKDKYDSDTDYYDRNGSPCNGTVYSEYYDSLMPISGYNTGCNTCNYHHYDGYNDNDDDENDDATNSGGFMCTLLGCNGCYYNGYIIMVIPINKDKLYHIITIVVMMILHAPIIPVGVCILRMKVMFHYLKRMNYINGIN